MKTTNIRRRIVLSIILVIAVYMMIVAGILFYPKNFNQNEYVLVIDKGDSLSSIARKLKNANVIYTRDGFLVLGKIRGLDSTIKPGVFYIHNPDSTWNIVKTIKTKPEKITVTLVAGFNYSQIQAVLAANPKVRSIAAFWPERKLLRFLDRYSDYLSIEGLLLPDIFYFDAGVEDKDIYRLSYRHMQQELQRQWNNRSEGLPYKSSYELLIASSLIEKETAHKQDRALVSAVLANRLKQGMRLQIDSSVIYGMGSAYKGKISKKDLLRDTPYNTYTRSGLPPTPIAMPSRQSLYAAAHPAPVNYLYFVSKQNKTGESYFSSNLKEHNQAVKKYILRQ